MRYTFPCTRKERESTKEGKRTSERERERRVTDGLGPLTSASSRGSLVADNKMHDLPFRLPERFAKRARVHRARKRSDGSNSNTLSERERGTSTLRVREGETHKGRREQSTTLFTQRHDVTKGDPRYIRATGRRHEL